MRSRRALRREGRSILRGDGLEIGEGGGLDPVCRVEGQWLSWGG